MAGLSAAGGWRSLVGGAGAFLGAGFAVVEGFSAAFSVRTGDGISADFSLSGRGRLLVPESLIGGEGTSLSGTGLVNGAGVVGEAGMSCFATSGALASAGSPCFELTFSLCFPTQSASWLFPASLCNHAAAPPRRIRITKIRTAVRFRPAGHSHGLRSSKVQFRNVCPITSFVSPSANWKREDSSRSLGTSKFGLAASRAGGRASERSSFRAARVIISGLTSQPGDPSVACRALSQRTFICCGLPPV